MFNNSRKFKILLESVQNKFNFWAEADNILDGKAAAILGFEATIGVGYATLVLKNLNDIKYAEGIIGLVFLFISAGLCLYITWPRNFITTSVNIAEHPEYLSKNEDELYLQLLSDSQNAFTKNNNKTTIKSKLFKLALILLLFSVFIFILSILNKFYV